MLSGRESNVVDLRVRAPRWTAGDGDFEFARQVIKIRISLEQLRDLCGKRRGVDQLVGGYSGQRAACHVADHIAAGSLGREPDGVQRIHNLRQRLDGEPVDLNVLAHGNIGEIARVFARQSTDGTKLRRGDDAIGNANAHHEIFGGQAFAAFAASSAHSVALRIDAPPLEISGAPFGQHAFAALPGKGAHFVESGPRVLFSLQALSLLGLRLFLLNCFSHFSSSPKNKNPAAALAVSRASGNRGFRSELRPRSPGRAWQHTAATTGLTGHKRILRASNSKVKVDAEIWFKTYPVDKNSEVRYFNQTRSNPRCKLFSPKSRVVAVFASARWPVRDFCLSRHKLSPLKIQEQNDLAHTHLCTHA